ncbi:MAG: 16S rRNA (adenine(1518)-N(6)/adenine(1519)-N(6))-dimethyltransferase RsmA [Patescibacteria group bacterium]
MNKQELVFLLNKYAIKPQRSKGQNFLLDQRVITKIIQAAELTKESLVVEIGPGVGVLTSALCEQAAHVIAVEVDQRMITILEKLTSVNPGLKIVRQDILSINYADLTAVRPYTLVGNLPYNITSAIFKHALESEHQPERMVVMVQKEVGERIMAKPGEMSLLALSVQLYGTPSFVTMVSRTSFHPQPDVTSMVIQIDQIHHPKDVHIKTLFKLAHMGFGGKRKQLHNTLAGGLRLSPDDTKRLMNQAKVDPTIRPQELSVQNWKDLANTVDHFQES